MIQKFFTILILLTISGCSLLGTKQIEVVSKPVQIDIMQPDLPRPVELTAPTWYVVSEAKIANPCKKVDDKRPKVCDLGDRENPDWPEGYTYLDRFLDDMKEQNNGEIVFVATSVGDYKVMAEDMQELKRYIKQLGEVVIYYRNVTMPDGQQGQGVGIKIDEPEALENVRG
jgi:hypothetical protein